MSARMHEVGRGQPEQLLAREYLEEIHRYREKDITDPRNERVDPVCAGEHPERAGHLRDQVSNSYPGGSSKWCPDCAQWPGQIWPDRNGRSRP